MDPLFRLPGAVKHSPAIAEWMRFQEPQLGEIAQHWFDVMRRCGADVREVLHDGHPTACVGDAAFAYVDTFKQHVNIGFFRGVGIADPEHLLAGRGKLMRHVKIRPGSALDAGALSALISAAYADMRMRVQPGTKK